MSPEAKADLLKRRNPEGNLGTRIQTNLSPHGSRRNKSETLEPWGEVLISQ